MIRNKFCTLHWPSCLANAVSEIGMWRLTFLLKQGVCINTIFFAGRIANLLNSCLRVWERESAYTGWNMYNIYIFKLFYSFQKFYSSVFLNKTECCENALRCYLFKSTFFIITYADFLLHEGHRLMMGSCIYLFYYFNSYKILK